MTYESNPARGIALGCLIGACLWLVIGLIVWSVL